MYLVSQFELIVHTLSTLISFQDGGDLFRAAAGLGKEPNAGDESGFRGAEALFGLRPYGGRQERGRVHALHRAFSRAV